MMTDCALCHFGWWSSSHAFTMHGATCCTFTLGSMMRWDVHCWLPAGANADLQHATELAQPPCRLLEQGGMDGHIVGTPRPAQEASWGTALLARCVQCPSKQPCHCLHAAKAPGGKLLCMCSQQVLPAIRPGALAVCALASKACLNDMSEVVPWHKEH